MKYTFKVLKKDIGQRLDLFITLNLPQFSRSHVKQEIVEERVLVNGVVEFHPQYRMKEGDEVQLTMVEEKVANKDIIKPTKIDFEVIYEDEHVLVINKPIWLVVHPAAGHNNDTLANGVKYYLQQKGEDKWDAKRAGLVHRLDSPTSGVIVFAKTPQALWQTAAQFAERKTKKVYLAVVEGKITGMLYLTSNLGRDRVNRKKISSRTKKPRVAYTEVMPLMLSRDGKFTLVKVLPLTGRTHQIRVHLAEEGKKIVGDGIYGGRKNQRLMLHALSLELEVDGKKHKFRAPIDQSFRDTLVKLDFPITQANKILKQLIRE